MNWGTRIVILYAGFVIMILVLVFRSGRENTDLVADDYYTQELQYQDHIDGQQELINSGLAPVVGLKNGKVLVQLPDELSGVGVKGTISFYRPDDKSKDRIYAAAAGELIFPVSDFSTGNYSVKMSWENGGKYYYNETSIYIP